MDHPNKSGDDIYGGFMKIQQGPYLARL